MLPFVVVAVVVAAAVSVAVVVVIAVGLFTMLWIAVLFCKPEGSLVAGFGTHRIAGMVLLLRGEDGCIY